MAKFLVTGGAGFIGSHLVERLIKDGHRVTVIDNFSSGRMENIAHLEGGDLRIIDGDIRDADLVHKSMRNVEYILHQAARPSVIRSIKDPMPTHAVNLDGTLNILEAARRYKSVKRLVFASSSSVYGDTPTLPKSESMPTHPVSPYAVTKLAGENYLRAYYENYGLETVALRYFNVFGPRQDPESEYSAVIPLFATRLLRGLPPMIYGDGKQTRDFTYVENVVEANLQALTAPKAAGDVFNIACGARVTILGLANLIAEAVGTSREPNMKDARSGEVRHSLADISKAEDRLGYRVRVSLLQGLTRTVEWYREHLE